MIARTVPMSYHAGDAGPELAGLSSALDFELLQIAGPTPQALDNLH